MANAYANCGCRSVCLATAMFALFRLFSATRAALESLTRTEHPSSLVSSPPDLINGRTPGHPSLHPPTYSPLIHTDGMLLRPVSSASAGAKPAPPSVVFHSTAVKGTPASVSAAFAAALKGQYVALKTTTSSDAMSFWTVASDVAGS